MAENRDGPSQRPYDPRHIMATIQRGAAQGRSAARKNENERSQGEQPRQQRSADVQPLEARAAGPLGKLLGAAWDRKNPPKLLGAGPDANSLVVLRRSAFTRIDPRTGDLRLPPEAEQALLRWAQDHDLGQVHDLVTQVTRRRERAVEQLRRQGRHVFHVDLEPEWRVVVGLGESDNPHEIGMSMHGTYGWPILPGSGLKGLTAAYMREEHAQKPRLHELYREIFGTWPAVKGEEGRAAPHKPKSDPQRGRVRFLDALATGGPLTVSVDVLTPHVKPYYDTTDPGDGTREKEPPAEYHQPVPIHFLTITAGTFRAHVVGDCARRTGHTAEELNERVRESRDQANKRTEQITRLAQTQLQRAGKTYGLGAKTFAGYGYMAAPAGGKS